MLKEVSTIFGINPISVEVYSGFKRKRTDIDRLEDVGINSIEKLIEELKKVDDKTSKLGRNNRDAVVNLANKVLAKIKESK